MGAKSRVIIDTDPGVDDVLALLLALSASPEELELLLISVTFGNVDVQSCLRNIITLFHFIEKEQEWRRQNGRPEGFETLKTCKPIVAVGAEEPLADQRMMADYFHGVDGLGGIYSTHPHLSPARTWDSLFETALSSTDPEEAAAAKEVQHSKALFTPSRVPAHEEILRLLRENEPNTITLIAIGPLTNFALAAATDPETFLRAKEVVVMGGTIDTPGNVQTPPPPLHYPEKTAKIKPAPFNLTKAPDTPLRRMLNLRNQITPCAEFNTYADSVAAARVFALTSKLPASTMPPVAPTPAGTVSSDAPPPFLDSYPKTLSKQLRLVLFPLDITSQHLLSRTQFKTLIDPLVLEGSPLASWANAFLSSTFAKVESLREAGSKVSLEMHDPLCLWYALDSASPKWTYAPNSPEDIRIETTGQWTRGMHVVDRRNRKRREDSELHATPAVLHGNVTTHPSEDEDDELLRPVPGDTGHWLTEKLGNRIWRMADSPGKQRFGQYLLERVFLGKIQ